MTHVILGATGQIGSELAKSLHADHANTIRLVSRNPRKVNDSDELFSADLLSAQQARKAVAGASVAYLTASRVFAGRHAARADLHARCQPRHGVARKHAGRLRKNLAPAL